MLLVAGLAIVAAMVLLDPKGALPSRRTIEGRVVDRDGAPLPGARIAIRRAALDVGEGLADVDGGFRMVVPYSSEYSAYVEVPGYPRTRATSRFQERILEIRLLEEPFVSPAASPPEPLGSRDGVVRPADPAGGSVSGRIVDADGNPIPGAVVSVVPSDPDRIGEVWVGADGSGLFRAGSLPAGCYQVDLHAEGWETSSWMADVEPGVDSSGGDLALRRLPVR